MFFKQAIFLVFVGIFNSCMSQLSNGLKLVGPKYISGRFAVKWNIVVYKQIAIQRGLDCFEKW